MLAKHRDAILKCITTSDEPTSAREIVKKLPFVNRATVYRELLYLEEKGFIQKISFGEGKARYEKTSEKCHHHLVCNNCGSIEHVQLNESPLLDQIKRLHFTLTKHSIEFFGLCNTCSN
jgi:Fur family ferric uptake transcriptional regulator